MTTKFVYDFAEGNKDMKDLLGGKGANLAEMTTMGLPVPPGFTITTEACLLFLEQGGAPPEMLQEAGRHLQGLQEAMGRELGDPDDPLLVSVRSGARFSMPGMMDTVRGRRALRPRRLSPVHPDVRQDRDGRPR
jgi:pyruvate,orthophosphate dikinase